MRIKFFTSELPRIPGAAWSSRGVRPGPAELHVYPLPRTIPGAISHPRRADHADLLVDRSRVARGAQLRDSGLANFAVGCLRTHRDHRAVHLVKRRKLNETFERCLRDVLRTSQGFQIFSIISPYVFLDITCERSKIQHQTYRKDTRKIDALTIHTYIR